MLHASSSSARETYEDGASLDPSSSHSLLTEKALSLRIQLELKPHAVMFLQEQEQRIHHLGTHL